MCIKDLLNPLSFNKYYLCNIRRNVFEYSFRKLLFFYELYIDRINCFKITFANNYELDILLIT